MKVVHTHLPLFRMTIEPLVLLVIMLVIASIIGRIAKRRLPRLLSWLVWIVLELGTVFLWIWLVYYRQIFLGG